MRESEIQIMLDFAKICKIDSATITKKWKIYVSSYDKIWGEEEKG